MTTGLHVKRSDKATTQPSVQPAGDFTADAPHKPARPGWPEAGSLLRFGETIKLEWMPDVAKNYNKILLQLTTNDKLSWKTIAKDLKFGAPATFTVPKISSRFCRMRLVAVEGDGQMTLLAQSGMFRIGSVADPTKIGPTKIEAPEDE